MQNWILQAGDTGCIWEKLAHPRDFHIMVECDGEDWTVTCFRAWGRHAQWTFESHRRDEEGIDQCLSFVGLVLAQAQQPAFDIAEAKQVLLELKLK